jgi:HIV Tat-specific factor 1
LPLDVTIDELFEEFTRWGGIIALNTDGKTPRIKMYTDDEGKFKGDALIVYLKADSVPLAIFRANQYSFRAGDNKNGVMNVQPAERSAKKHQTKESAAGKMSRQDRKNAERVRAEQNA